MVFLCIFRNYPINEMPQCQFPVFCCFCVSEKLHRKYSRNWTKQKPEVQIFTGASRRPKRRRRGATGRPHHRAAWPRAGPRPLVVRSPGPTSDDAPSPIKTPDGKNLNTRSLFQNTSRSAAVVDPRSGGSRSSSRHPAGEGNRHRRSSSSPCLPPVR
jgi:hypothetical protein